MKRNCALLHRRKLFKEAKETKETWSDEESYVNVRNNTGNITSDLFLINLF